MVFFGLRGGREYPGWIGNHAVTGPEHRAAEKSPIQAERPAPGIPELSNSFKHQVTYQSPIVLIDGVDMMHACLMRESTACRKPLLNECLLNRNGPAEMRRMR